MGFLTFNRAMEREADYLGLQYMYKAGYDPTAFVDFFDKIQSLEKKKPGTISKVFASHPMTDERIKAAQKNIQELLKAKPEYVVTTSEFNDVRGRLVAMNSRHKVQDADPNRPTLRKAPGSGSTVPVDGSGKDTTTTGDNPDDRPTLKRRD
jgi:predicted Zn-dependent protease